MSYLQDTSDPLQFNIEVNGTTYVVPMTNSGGASYDCSDIPNNTTYNTQLANKQALLNVFNQISSEPYSDQLGVVGAAIIFAHERLAVAGDFTDFWQGRVDYCDSHWTGCFWGAFGCCTWCCKGHIETCESRRTELVSRTQDAATEELVWAQSVSSLIAIEDTILSNMGNYLTTQAELAEFAALLAELNVQIAESNLAVQAVESKLLDLRNKELKMKASYLVAPLLLIVGLALIFND